MRLLTKVLHWIGVDDAPDPAWRATGYRYTQRGHDERAAALTAIRNDQVAESRRKLAAVRSDPPKTP